MRDDVRRTRLIALVIFVVVVGFGLAWSRMGTQPGPAVSMPAFSAPAPAATPAPARRTTILPTNCDETVSGPVDVTALLGRPVGSVAVRTVQGLPSPSVGQVERLSCNYRDATKAHTAKDQNTPLLQLTATAFTDPAAADAQRLRNLAVEQQSAPTATPVALGQAKATLLTGPDHTVLMVAYDRYTVTASMVHGLFPATREGPVLVDLACRVLPSLIPPPGSTVAGPRPTEAALPPAPSPR